MFAADATTPLWSLSSMKAFFFEKFEIDISKFQKLERKP
jgi:hypothetical protein